MSVVVATELEAILRAASVYVLDVDSTVCTDEGIDKLAEHCGVGQAVRDWTNKAMGGNVTFQESFQQRLDIMKPTLAQVEEVAAEEPSLTPGVKEFTSQLHAQGKAVYLVSGGIRRLIDPVAAALEIPASNIFSNVLHFHADGTFSHFDDTQPTSRSGGKPEAVAAIMRDHPGAKVVMVGDGVTDMEAKPPADAFVGFGGNVVRDRVREGADVFVTSFDLLTTLVAAPETNQAA